jgi:hypothetical protein
MADCQEHFMQAFHGIQEVSHSKWTNMLLFMAEEEKRSENREAVCKGSF